MIVLFTSRKFWALVVGMVFLILVEFFPNFQLDQEATIGLIVIVASYILGVAVDPGQSGWRGVLRSRKFWAAFVGLVVMLLNGFGVRLPAELTPDFLVWMAVLLGGYISGVALESRTLFLLPARPLEAVTATLESPDGQGE